jgi:hypothetical protein
MAALRIDKSHSSQESTQRQLKASLDALLSMLLAKNQQRMQLLQTILESHESYCKN